MQAEEGGAILSTGELMANIALLLQAGNVTTTDQLGTGMRALLDHPDQVALLRAEPARMANAVEEVLRFEAAVSETGRGTVDGRPIAGCPVPAGQYVTTFLHAANRDPRVHPDPDRFDICRAVDHVSFGGGRHHCLGSQLARLELEVAFTTLLTTFPALRLAEQEYVYRNTPGFRGLMHLWVHAT